MAYEIDVNAVLGSDSGHTNLLFHEDTIKNTQPQTPAPLTIPIARVLIGRELLR
jgi:hypothetical protein